MTRGIKHDVDRMIENLASLHLPYTAKTAEGKDEHYVVQAHLQPIQLWSYVFPEQHLDTILRTLKPMDTMGIPLDKTHIGYGFGSPKRKSALWALRKAMGLKKIPEWKPEGLKFPIWNENTQVVGIGIKEDYKNQYGNECL